jgi:hypothetical protein
LKAKLKNLLKPIGGKKFELQFLFLTRKIFVFVEVMDICVKIFFFKMLTTLDHHNFLGWFTPIFVKKLWIEE